jgi:hypothetical protein
MSDPVREWLSRCVCRLEAMPPTPARDESLRMLQSEIARHENNIVPFRRRGK